MTWAFAFSEAVPWSSRWAWCLLCRRQWQDYPAQVWHSVGGTKLTFILLPGVGEGACLGVVTGRPGESWDAELPGAGRQEAGGPGAQGGDEAPKAQAGPKEAVGEGGEAAARAGS